MIGSTVLVGRRQIVVVTSDEGRIWSGQSMLSFDKEESYGAETRVV